MVPVTRELRRVLSPPTTWLHLCLMPVVPGCLYISERPFLASGDDTKELELTVNDVQEWIDAWLLKCKL